MGESMDSSLPLSASHLQFCPNCTGSQGAVRGWKRLEGDLVTPHLGCQLDYIWKQLNLTQLDIPVTDLIGSFEVRQPP